ncbi:rho GTPase-activating protein 12 isoform X2 [Colossoma macropomum]|uniref:rho GTPase-activating protein 12 isoform X2 n=1 Tax=Colossoma macropomum TaxID=42526 RepID=UPI001863D851|nr:rho GTPase-activating protein 12 isoform X2 [Colossoma macropomum]
MGEVGKMASSCSMGLVLVEFEYEYMGRDGCMVSIKPNERYTLLAKTNNHWWHVRKDERAKPFYIPAKYVKELPPTLPSPLDFADPPGPEPRPPAPDLAEKPKPNEVTIRLRSPGNCRKTDNRMSTFGVPLDIHDPPSYLHGGLADSLLSLHPVPSVPAPDAAQQKKRLSLAPNLLFGSRGAPIEDASQKSRVPSFSPADPLPRQAKPVEPPTVKNLTEPRHQGLPPKPEPLIEPDEESSPEPTGSSDTENIYESILDLKLDDLIKTEPVPTAVQEPAASAPASAPQAKPENENPTTAVYANVTDLKKTTRSAPSSSSTCSSPGLSLSPAPDSALSPDPVGWEVHTDQDSGKAFYYHPATQQSSWADPRSPTPAAGMEASATALPAPSSTSPALPRSSDWEQLLDETTGRHYYYNHTLKQTTWVAPEPQADGPVRHSSCSGVPPLPEEDYPTEDHGPQNAPHAFKDALVPQGKLPVLPRVTLDPGTPIPTGWTCSTEPGGKTVFTNEHTHQQWIQSKDDKGKTYYYLKDGSKSQWTLPEAAAPSGPPPLGNGLEPDAQPILKNWRHTMGQINTSHEDTKFFPSHRRIASDYASDTSSTGNSPEIHHQEDKLRQRRNLSSTDPHHHHHALLLEKAGILNKTKVADNGKKLRKNWAQSWTVLHGGILTFYKDPKSTPGGNVTKTNQIVPEYTVELKGAAVYWASKEKSSKKNVLELKTRHGSEYLMQYDTDSIIHDWHKIIQDTIRHLDHDHYSEEEEDEVMEKSPQPNDRERKNTAVRQSSTAAADTDQGRVRTKLRKFLQRRPTLQSVKDKGYIKYNVFGCHLDTLCHRENTNVPRFVEKCIKAVERRGLNVDGIYRVSGNLAVIQKLRHKADHEEDLDLDDGQWEEIHVITGALKLFFRELPEPLFPYSFFDKFIAAIKITDYSQKVSYMQDLVRALPVPNHNTMEVLFKHLRKVIEHGDSNRMSVQSMAIVFGPTLLRPEEESGNITVHMVFQNQIVELILNEFNEVFRPR